MLRLVFHREGDSNRVVALCLNNIRPIFSATRTLATSTNLELGGLGDRFVASSVSQTKGCKLRNQVQIESKLYIR